MQLQMPAKKKAAAKLHGSVESSDWSGGTKTTRQGCPEGEQEGAHQKGIAGIALPNGTISTNTMGEKIVEKNLVDCTTKIQLNLAA